MTDHEAVLCDLLLECGVEGVTLWHIRALAAWLRVRAAQNWRVARWSENRWDSDRRGEAAVLAEAWSMNAQFEAYARDRSDAVRGASMSLNDLPDDFGG